MKNRKARDFAEVYYVGPERYADELERPDVAHKMGEIAGYWTEDKEQHLRIIDAHFKQRVVDVVSSLKEQLYELFARRKSYEYQLQRIANAKSLERLENKALPYSILEALLYTALGLLFWGAEVAVLMGTVANALGMNITFDEIILRDPGSYDGLLLALAIAASPFILKQWLERYIIVGVYQKEKKADVLFRYLLIPVGTLTILFVALTGLFRWYFQPLIMDANEYLIWKDVFTREGHYAIFGAIFMVTMVLTLLISSSLSLSIGLYHLKGMLAGVKRLTEYAKYHLWKFRRDFKTIKLLSHKERIEREMADHPERIKRSIEALEAKRDVMRESFLAGYNAGELRYRRFRQKQQEEKHRKEQQLFADMPLHQYFRHLVTEKASRNGQAVGLNLDGIPSQN